MFCVMDPRAIAPLSLAEARRILNDLDYAMQVDPLTRMMAFRVCQAARTGRTCPVLVLVAGEAGPTPEPPKDAA